MLAFLRIQERKTNMKNWLWRERSEYGDKRGERFIAALHPQKAVCPEATVHQALDSKRREQSPGS